jgi:hypothetical protein
LISRGYDTLTTPSMKETFAPSCQEHGLFLMMLSPEPVAIAAATVAHEGKIGTHHSVGGL